VYDVEAGDQVTEELIKTTMNDHVTVAPLDVSS
jgi:hypothetical protein